MKKKHILFMVGLLCAAILLSALPTVATAASSGDFSLTADEQAYLETLQARTITVAYSHDLVQVGMIEPVLDVLRDTFGLTVEWVKLNWQDAFAQIEAGTVDFYGLITISETRRAQYIVVEPFYRSYSKMISRKDTPVHTMSGLYNRSIGLLEDSIISQTMQAYLGSEGEVSYYPTMEALIDALINGDIDAFPTVDNAEFEILQHNDIQFEFSIDNFYVDQGFISGREDMQMLADLLSRYLQMHPQISEAIVEARRDVLIRRTQAEWADEIAYMQSHYEEAVIYADASLYPLCYLEDGEIKGMQLDINAYFEALTGVKIRIADDHDTNDGIIEAIEKLKAGQYLALVGSYFNVQTWLDSTLEYSPLLWRDTMRVCAYADENGVEAGQRIGSLRSTVDYLGWNNITGSEPILYDSNRDLINALNNGEVDAIFMGEMRLNYGYSVLGDYSICQAAGISAEVSTHMLYAAHNEAFNALYNQSMVLFHILSPNDLGKWRSMIDIYKSDYIRMRHSQQRNTMVIIFVFTVMLAALIYLFVRNIKAHRNTKKELVSVLDKVHIDELTGIYNRRYMEESLVKVIKSLSRSNGTLSVMMLDVDFFKKYNDTYGHGEGDICLKMVATVIRDSLSRTDDFVARYGGEEFVVVLPNTDESGARVLSSRILENVRACKRPHEKNEAAEYITVSIGVTTGVVGHSQTGADYIKQADKALYRSKHSGRDRYTFVAFDEPDV